jgi:hypothetical protein
MHAVIVLVRSSSPLLGRGGEMSYRIRERQMPGELMQARGARAFNGSYRLEACVCAGYLTTPSQRGDWRRSVTV